MQTVGSEVHRAAVYLIWQERNSRIFKNQIPPPEVIIEDIRTAVYLIWQERNSRIFKNKIPPPEVIIEDIRSTVRCKLLGLKFKNTTRVWTTLRVWKIDRQKDLVGAAAVYLIWQERNSRIFKNQIPPPEVIIEDIRTAVYLIWQERNSRIFKNQIPPPEVIIEDIRTAVYLIWQERNSRIFKNKIPPPEVIIEDIRSTVRCKLLGLKFKNTTRVWTTLRVWKIDRQKDLVGAG
ncbi:hypothetical protein QVD17_39656 [Tagetes erecta]|uniref:Uncharacterized protein n=1 Tax=Tagetes erecta TaxID=13708 RepID=A0AAD8JSU0_TARER|nr:hypothetical protein QVD17_39656 [Tagetes erecta]